ncbi:tubulin polyglutamylase TTLL13-like isoform X2 [Periplaneta americana]|uniref:tubulin polyglutamylase TTLL13-like isoform X2 n=1 Tax=Periplaneta americana TaxID=6978 RepID=UPI0037E70081
MNSGRERKLVSMVRPSKIMELVNGHNSSNGSETEAGGEHSPVEYVTTPDGKTVDETLTLIDIYDSKFSSSREFWLGEDVLQDSGEEKKVHQNNALITNQYEGPSHVPHKPPVPKTIVKEPEKKFSPGDDGRKAKRKKKRKKRRYGELVAYARTKRNRTFICKPETGCQGRGIFVTKNIKDIKPHDKMVCQVYISRPFLVDGFKFDLRIYVLITSCDPLRVYVYNDGLARFATSRYREPSLTNIGNAFMHLTNYAVNKHSRTYVVDDEAGSKRKISTLTNWLQRKDYNVQELLENIDDVVIKTVIAAHPILKHNYHACFPAHDFTYACFELLGFDILLDCKLKPYILEVNHSPSFHTDAQIDRDIKESLLRDTFIILNLTQADKKKVLEEDRRRVRERLLQGINHKESETGSNGTYGSVPQNPWKTQVAWEESHMGNFRCIYPYHGVDKYEQFFHQNQISLFQDTAASRAREECARLQREELEGKAKAAARRMGWKSKDLDKLRPESPLSRDNKPIPKMKKRHIPVKKLVPEKKQSFLNSFEPDPIVEAEEKERSMAMAQREFLLKSFGITEQIIHAMKKNGSFTLDEEKKLSLFGKLRKISYLEEEDTSRLPSMFSNSKRSHCPLHVNRNNFFINSNSTHVNDEATVSTSTERLQSINCAIPLQPLAGLSITCNNAPIFIRPHIPRAILLEEGVNKDKDVRFTKTHMARSITNTYKLQELEKREQQRQFQNESRS